MRWMIYPKKILRLFVNPYTGHVAFPAEQREIGRRSVTVGSVPGR